MVNLLEQLKDMSDIVIIDGTPSQLVTDSLILARLVDSTLIVTSSKETKKEDLRRIINNIVQVGGKIAGVVVNKITLSSKRYEQSYYYGSTSAESLKNRTINVMQPRKVKPTQTAKFTDRPNKEVLKKQENSDIDRLNKVINNEEEIPETLINNIEVDKEQEDSISKTRDILDQINQYIEQEKKKKE